MKQVLKYQNLFNIIGDPKFKERCWRAEHCVWRQAISPSEFPQVSDIEDKLSASLLKWPYFTILQEGRSPPPTEYTSSRDVIGQKIDGFANSEAIWRFVKNGATLKLNDLSHWNREVHDLVTGIEGFFDAAATSYAFLTPEDNRGMLPHRDASHVFAFQIEGVKEWHIYANNSHQPSQAGLDVDDDQLVDVIELEPGDVIYLPHGVPHDAVARRGRSFHLTVTANELSPEDLLEGLLRDFRATYPEAVDRHHVRPLPQKCNEVRNGLMNLVNQEETVRWLKNALAHSRGREI